MEDMKKAYEELLTNSLQWQEFIGIKNSEDCVLRKASALARVLTSQQAAGAVEPLQSSESLPGISKTDRRWWDVYYDFLLFGMHIADREAFKFLGECQTIFMERLCREVVEICSVDFRDDERAAQFKTKFFENFSLFQEEFAEYKQVGRRQTTDFLTDHLNYAFAKRILSRFGLEQNLRHIVSVFSAAHALEILLNIPRLLQGESSNRNHNRAYKDKAARMKWQPYQPARSSNSQVVNLENYFDTGQPLERQLTEYHRVQKLPTAIKRGLCVFIQAHTIGGLACNAITRLGPEEAAPVIREIAGYILFETVKQVWHYGPDGRPREGAKEICDTVVAWFARRFQIPVVEKLQEYQQAENPLSHLTLGIGRVAGHDLEKGFRYSITVSAYFEPLVENIERTFTLSDQQMTEEIQRFFTNLVKRQ